MIRNLIYHIWPSNGNGLWRRNIAQLLRRWGEFNGQKIISIVTGPGTASFAEVKRCFPDDAVFFDLKNDPGLGEVVSFGRMMKCVVNADDPNQITFYAHAKGVKYPPESLKKLKVHSWSEVMYSAMLDYPDLIEVSLQTHGIVGTFMKHGNAFGTLPPSWHYAGTYFWFRNDAVFGRNDWEHIPQQWWGTEVWPCLAFSNPKDAECLLLEDVAPTMQLYKQPYWKAKVDAVWRSFQEKHASMKRHSSYAEVISTLKFLGVKRILVTGPQRSGTTIASKMISNDLKLPCIDEMAFGAHSFDQFYEMARKPAYVIQCPTMSPYVHLVPGAVVIWMRRDLRDVLRSQRRIGWDVFEGIEKDRYFYGGHQEAAVVKTEAWCRFQRVALGERAFDLDYASLTSHPMWVDPARRQRFGPKQTQE